MASVLVTDHAYTPEESEYSTAHGIEVVTA